MKNEIPGVYLIRNKKKELYIGSTNNLERRIKEHNQGKCSFTKKYSNWQLIYFEKYNTLNKARKAERQIKQSRYQRDQFYLKARLK